MEDWKNQTCKKSKIVQSTPKESSKSGNSGDYTSKKKIEPSDQLKVINIMQKLKCLECPLISNKEDACIEEILFKQNFDRYILMEWIFSKLEFSTSKKLEFSVLEEDEFQNSSEVKIKNLLGVISSFGICSKDRSDIIEGLAPFKDQLKFWKLLVDILWKKGSRSFNQSESLSSSSSSKGSTSIVDQYELQRKYISKLCETVNFGHLFKEKVDLFPTYLLEESKNITSKSPVKIENLQNLKAVAEKNYANRDLNNLSKLNLLEENEVEVSCNESGSDDEELDELEYEISSALSDLQLHSNDGFDDAYNNLKLYLSVPTDESIDVGPSFQTANYEVNRLLKLKTALSTLKSSESEIKTLSSDLKDFQVPSHSLSDSLLREFMVALK
ncbi:hypothetical protein JTE90_003119 [Oedothorax gibbosus]|uniref:HAUS augmin-like complex subunit 6 N-terminal domain-containing protein n=1 Tax=Oedothorax gibbosus TaxID=931172 RepID=A0AAV6VEP3_9ARAC|nr:hypothetical protein JTE90_003119 [Oedothorax gibbosus]